MPVLLMVVFGKLMTVNEADAMDEPLVELVPVVIAGVAVTVPDVEESVVDVEDGMQPIPRPRAPLQSVVVNEDDAEVV